MLDFFAKKVGLYTSFTWNLVSQHSDFFSKHYYDTPWENWANRLVGIEMHD